MAICAVLVIAVIAVCIFFIAKESRPDDPADSDQAYSDGIETDTAADTAADTEEMPQYKPVDTQIETGDATDNKIADTDSDSDTEKEQTETADGAPDTDKEVVTADTDKKEPEKTGTDLGDGLFLVSIEPYSGAFVEDGSDEPVENIISIVVKNAGDSAVQMVDITLGTDYGDAEFSATTLLPNTSTVILEKNRMKYPGADKFGAAKIELLGRFIEEPSFFSDKFEIKGTDGFISVKNKSGKDIPENVRVYYKTVNDGKYLGGITYQATLSGGISAGDTIILSAAHFKIDGSRLMFVKYE